MFVRLGVVWNLFLIKLKVKELELERINTLFKFFIIKDLEDKLTVRLQEKKIISINTPQTIAGKYKNYIFETMQQQRIEWICEALSVPSNIKTIIDFVNEKAHKLNLNEKDKNYSQRTIEADINKIRKGKFLFSNNIKNKEKGELFKLEYDRANNIYYFDENYHIPEFNKNTIEENLTLPFIEGILAPYQELAGIKKVIEKIKEFYPIRFDSNEFKSAVVTTNCITDNGIITNLKNKSTEILLHISLDNIISFNYIKVNNESRELSDTITYKVLPLQVRIHEELYYLIAHDIKKGKIITCRIDQIKTKIEKVNSKIGEAEIKSIKNNFNERYFDYSFGVWRPITNDVYTLKIIFTEWAAQYVMYKPIHKSQTIKTNKSTKGIEVTIKLHLDNEPKIPFDLENLSKELAFSLTRFRNNYEVVSIVKN